MKKILMALAITAIAYTGAEAQAKCGTNEKKVCRHSGDGNTVSCYETKYAQNFKVCKGATGYHICCGELDNAAGDIADDATTYTVTRTYDAYAEAFPEDNAAVTNTTTTVTTLPEENIVEEKETVVTTVQAVSCGENEKQVCRKTADGKVACYKTDYAQNFKVCKGAAGYYICCNPPSTTATKTIYPPRM